MTLAESKDMSKKRDNIQFEDHFWVKVNKSYQAHASYVSQNLLIVRTAIGKLAKGQDNQPIHIVKIDA